MGLISNVGKLKSSLTSKSNEITIQSRQFVHLGYSVQKNEKKGAVNDDGTHNME